MSGADRTDGQEELDNLEVCILALLHAASEVINNPRAVNRLHEREVDVTELRKLIIAANVVNTAFQSQYSDMLI